MSAHQCLEHSIDIGIAGGGIGEYLTFELERMPGTPTQPSFARLFFDIIFFGCVTIVLLNIVFGIMIGELKCAVFNITQL